MVNFILRLGSNCTPAQSLNPSETRSCVSLRISEPAYDSRQTQLAAKFVQQCRFFSAIFYYKYFIIGNVCVMVCFGLLWAALDVHCLNNIYT